MVRVKILVSCLALFSSMAMMAQADVLVLRSGKSIKGTLVGANARQVDFLMENGKTEQIPINSINRITFSAPVTQQTAAASKPAATAAPARPSVMIPAGTTVRVRTLEPIDVDVTQAGATFKGSVDDPIMIGGSLVVPRGAEVMLQATKVKQSGKMKGSDLVELKVNVMVINGSRYQVATTFQEIKGGSEGKSTAKKVVGGGGLGAIIGGIAGGGKGAAIGAVVGAAGGAAISAGGEQHLKVPPETRLEFRLESDLKI